MEGSSRPSIILACDHAPLGLLPGLDRIDWLVRQPTAQNLAGVILNYGPLKRLAGYGQPSSVALIARVDGNRSMLSGEWTKSAEWEMLYSIEACQKAGAHAAIVNLLLGTPAEMSSLRVVARAAAECHELGVPLFVSAICLDTQSALFGRNDRYAFAARMAYELGADSVNLYDVQDASAVGAARQWCPLPVYAQGAPSSCTDAELVAWSRNCVASGAEGVVVGRSIWQNANGEAMLATLLDGLADSPS